MMVDFTYVEVYMIDRVLTTFCFSIRMQISVR